MAFTEFYVTKTSANNLYGGSSEALIDNPGDVTAVHDGAGSHTLTDNGVDGFSNTSVDDFICWDTAGAAEYARVTAVTSSDIIVVLNMVGAVAFTGLENKAVNVGGCWATVGHATTTVTPSFVNAAGDVPRMNVKYSATAYNEYITCHTDFTTAIPGTLEGYYSTPGDDCMNGGVWTPPEISGVGQSGAAIIYSNGGAFWRIRNLWLHGNVAGDHGIYFFNGATGWLVDRCKIDMTGATGTVYGVYSSYYWSLIRNCYIVGCATHGVRQAGRGNHVEGCYIKDAGVNGIYMGGVYVQSAIGNIIDSPGDDGIYVSGAYAGNIRNNVVYNSTAGSGIRLGDLSNVYGGSISNNLCVGNNQYGIELDDAFHYGANYNAYYNNGVAEVLNVPARGPDEVTLTGDPFTNAAGGDFSLNNTAGAGAACRNAGFPGAMIDGTNEGFADIGALRHEDPAGGGGLAKLVGFGGGLVG